MKHSKEHFWIHLLAVVTPTMHTLYDNTVQGLISDDGLSTKHHILNMLRVQLSQDEEQTLGFEEVNESMAEDIITELDRMERIPK